MDKKGLRKSGAVLFMGNPWGVSHATPVKIGAFNERGVLLRDDVVECPVIMQPDRVMDILLNKYVQGTNEVVGLMMTVKYPYPERALREAVMNAIVHRDYSSVVETCIRVYPDRVRISNPGRLPNGWTKDGLAGEHGSEPANPKIARAFFSMGYIEKYGTGIGMMRGECAAAGVPEPEYVVEKRVVGVIFRLPEKRDDTVRGKVDAMDG
jgi:ATP-dependent DNA helicase RecG